jgi:hypothetical protein
MKYMGEDYHSKMLENELDAYFSKTDDSSEQPKEAGKCN